MSAPTFNRRFQYDRPLAVALVEPLYCPRCQRTVERARTILGAGGYRQCADVAVCSSTSVPRSTVIGMSGEMRTLNGTVSAHGGFVRGGF